MEIEYVLKKLKEQRYYLPTTNLDTWFPATYKYIEGYFQNDSSEARRFRELKQKHVSFSSFSKHSLGMYSSTAAEIEKNNKADFLKEVAGVLEEIIEILEHKLEKQQQLLAKQATKAVEKKEPVAEQVPTIVYKTRFPFGIAPEFFWGILVVIVGFAYWLGLKLETYQIHEENKELKEQIKQMQKDTTAVVEKIRLNESELKDTDAVAKDATKILLPDTIKVLTKSSTNLTKKKN